MFNDDGDPEWVDEVTYEPVFDYAPMADGIWAGFGGPEVFVDIPHPSPFYKGEVIRLRSQTFSPEFLRFYTVQTWSIPHSMRAEYVKSESPHIVALVHVV